MSYECMSASQSFSVSLTLFLSLSIYTTEQAYNQTVELAVCSFLNGSLSRILELIFYHFVYQKNIRDCSAFFGKNMFLSCFAARLSIFSEQKT
jgi:RsiW-degrading membrane proteinase PrsW (M82 family)